MPERKSKLLQVVRRDLPIWSHQDEIRQCLRERDVLLLVGETGSGKSTQVPQFLLNESWCRTQRVKVANSRTDASLRELPVGGCIAVTEPRRVAAISLARRVAAEMGSAVGSSSPASQVGYSVRFDNSTSPSTRIKFLTEGMLLQELLRDPWLRQYSAVVIDEVHERGVNVDLVVGFLRNLVVGGKEGRGGHALKVVVMSATADLEVLCDFFEAGYRELTDADAPTAETGETVESESSWSGISESEEEGVEKKTTLAVTGSPTDLKSYRDRVRLCSIQGRQYPVQVMYAPAPVQDLVDGTLRTIMQIHCGEAMPGDILVFLTGQEDIEAVERLVMDCNGGLKPGVPKIMVRPLFAALPQHVQQEAFLPAPHGRRKVVLATNIAETSVTVPGVRYVVDGGKAKIKQFRSRLGLDSLLAKPISKSSSMQRKGRAGREAPGKCYRLYTERDYLTLEQSNTPEISRCDITPTVLTIKARGVEDILSFPFLTPPPREALEKALMQLWTIGALDESGGVSFLGAQMARLPLDPALSRVLLAAASPDGDCLLEVIDIISCLTVENLFLNVTSEEQKEEAEAARRELIRREGDHLTLLTTIQKYGAEETDRRAWAERHFVSHRAMQAVTDVRKQLRAQCRQQKLLKSDQALDDVSSMTSERASTIMKCFLKGFASKTARLCGDGSYKTMMGNHAIAIHPSSSLFGRRVEAIVYNEYLFTNKSYAKGVSAVQMDWIMQALGVGD
ncbi:MAG: putative ATP-dependent RNA helicase dhr2 [Thelocarpon superellum]|nr:MAG: putative ATP-dependent RNA helicase dhr2 [Thelocarpon superellum]